jgi:hypothetical protein
MPLTSLPTTRHSYETDLGSWNSQHDLLRALHASPADSANRTGEWHLPSTRRHSMLLRVLVVDDLHLRQTPQALCEDGSERQ